MGYAAALLVFDAEAAAQVLKRMAAEFVDLLFIERVGDSEQLQHPPNIAVQTPQPLPVSASSPVSEVASDLTVLVRTSPRSTH